MGKKRIRFSCISIVEIETELPTEEAIKDFFENGESNFKGTEGVQVIQSEWVESEPISVLRNI